jgi:transposase
MDMNFIHTIRPREYRDLSQALSAKTLSDEHQAEILEIIREHQALTTAALKSRTQQLKDATGLLAAPSSKGDRLFPEPKPEAYDDNDVSPSDPNDTQAPPQKRPSRKPAKVVDHKLDLSALKCPCCQKAMHRAHKKIVTIIRVQGLSEERHEIETARCLTCNTKAEAKGPEEKTVLQFSVHAASVITSLRYVYGLPSYRLEEVTASMGYRIPDSSQWDLFEASANELLPFHRFLHKEAANAGVVQMDDTNVRINQVTTAFALAKMEGQKPDRTGVHTTGFIAKFALGKICLFKSGVHHAGEFFERIMQAKSTAEQVILMTDAASSNTCKLPNLPIEVVQANCNSHAVRRFDEVAENPIFEEDAGEILKLYSAIFEREQRLKELSPEERWEIHRRESLPQMNKIKQKIESDLNERLVEPSSALGDAYKYFLNHFEKLCAFCTTKGSPVCNNETERLLKRAIRHRKNSMFYKTMTGAAVGDIHMTILMTAKENKIEPVKYMTDLLTNIDKVKDNPSDWLPWNYAKTMEALNPEAATL